MVLSRLDEKMAVAVSEWRRGVRVHPALHMLSWIFFSNLTLLFNKYIIHSTGFRYPVILTAWHLVFATLATQFLAHFTPMLSSRSSIRLTPRLYLHTVLPIGLLYSGSLVFSNIVYLYLSLAYVQMLKAAAPVAVLLAGWSWGVAEPSLRALFHVMVIVLGVGMASYGEMHFSWIGFFFQAGGIAFEAVRLIMVQVMLSDQGLRMDPLVGLYYYAPVCALMNVLIAIMTEVPHFETAHLAQAGVGTLFLSALVAFMLNVSSVFLIGRTSGLVLTLTGIFKNILLVIVSILIWQTKLSSIQLIGYIIAVIGLLAYSLSPAQKPKSLVDLDRQSSWQDPSKAGKQKRLSRLTTLGIFCLTTILVIGSVIWTVLYLRGKGYTGRETTRFIVSWFGSL